MMTLALGGHQAPGPLLAELPPVGGPASPLAATFGTRLVALDGLRGLAILMVLFVHFIGDAEASSPLERGLVKLANYGIWGVDLFFVLSGFLITGILYDAKEKPHYFRDFYLRRTLRIFPLYYGVLAGLFIMLPALPVGYPATLATSASHQAWLWLYGTNFYLAAARTWALPYTSHFWSLAVEEHFYLVWPIVVLTASRATLQRICVAVAVFSLALRVGLSLAGIGHVALVVLTPCRLDALCIGAFLSIAVRSHGVAHVARATRPWLAVLPGLVLVTSLWNAATGRATDLVLPLRGSLVALSFGAVLIASLVAPTSAWHARLIQSPGMRFLGKYSYGLYVFHGMVAYALMERRVFQALTVRVGSSFLALLTVAVGGTLVSLLVAVASYELFEKRFLRLKDRLAPAARATDVVARHAASSLG
jgi:peptidoglycan/LPS O-acetylase OafA/YrhL